MSQDAKSRAHTITAKLSAYAKTQGTPYDRALTIFLLERAAVRLVADPDLHRHIVFKGGFVGVRVYQSPRHTKDLDATVNDLAPDVAAAKIRAAMAADPDDGTWFLFDEAVEIMAQGQQGAIRLTFRGGLGERPKQLDRAQLIDIDLGPGDRVVPAPRMTQTPLLLGDGSLTWMVYPVETIIAEKLHAMIARGAGNSRSKDVFDVNLLLPKASVANLSRALQATFQARGDQLPAFLSQTLKIMDRTLVRKGWKSATVSIKAATDFDDTMDAVIKMLADKGF